MVVQLHLNGRGSERRGLGAIPDDCAGEVLSANLMRTRPIYVAVMDVKQAKPLK